MACCFLYFFIYHSVLYLYMLTYMSIFVLIVFHFDISLLFYCKALCIFAYFDGVDLLLTSQFLILVVIAIICLSLKLHNYLWCSWIIVCTSLPLLDISGMCSIRTSVSAVEEEDLELMDVLVYIEGINWGFIFASRHVNL